jgi:hypothetical protein
MSPTHVILSERGEVRGGGVEAKDLALAILHNLRNSLRFSFFVFRFSSCPISLISHFPFLISRP